MHPSDEAWILYRESLGYSRESSLAILAEYAKFVAVATDNTADRTAPEVEDGHGN